MAFLSGPYDIYLAIFAATLSVIWFSRRDWKNHRLPPGPRGFPIVGFIPYILGKGCPGEKVNNLAKIYGKIFGGWMGKHYVIFLSDYNIIKEAMGRKGDAFNDRPRIAITEILGQLSGIGSCILDNHWKEHRRFTMQVLRQFGMGKEDGVLTKQSMREAQELVKLFHSTKGQPFAPDLFVGMVACNIASYILFGKRFDFEDKLFHEMVEVIEYVMKNGDAAGLISYFPILKYLPNGTYKTCFNRMRGLENRIQTRIVGEREVNFDPTKSPKDLVDSYLWEMHDAKVNRRATTFSHHQLIRVCSDMLVAGTDTTATLMRWLLIYCSKFVTEQRLVQEEIDQVLGRDTPPSWKDRSRLPYTMAFLAETMRYSILGLFGVPHSTYCDTKLYNFDIPKDTIIMLNMTALLKDPDVFPEPEKFKPARFLDEDNMIIKSLVERTQTQFGIGRRVCVGKDIGWSESFIYTATLLQNFDIIAPNGSDSVDISAGTGLTRTPRPFEIIARAR